MDAQEPDFPEGSFDVVLSRNLTWTLPDPEKAYSQWLRVLRRGGLLLNFDADYAANVRSESTQNCSVPPDSPYGHVGMTRELVEENNAITLALDIGKRPPGLGRSGPRKNGRCPLHRGSDVGPPDPGRAGPGARTYVSGQRKESIKNGLSQRGSPFAYSRFLRHHCRPGNTEAVTFFWELPRNSAPTG